MKLQLDFEKVIEIIRKAPEAMPLLGDKTDGFKHLYENVYLPIMDEPDEEYVKLHVDIWRFTFDDLVNFDSFIHKKTRNSYNSPVNFIDQVVTTLPPAIKPTIFI